MILFPCINISAPQKPPSSITMINRSSTSLTLKWDPVDEAVASEDITYVVRYKPSNSNDVKRTSAANEFAVEPFIDITESTTSKCNISKHLRTYSLIVKI